MSLPQGTPGDDRSVSRRAALGGVLAGGLGLAAVGVGAGYVACGRQIPAAGTPRPELIAQVEADRRHSGRTQNLTLTPKRSQVDLGGRTVAALTYGDALPGAEVRVGAEDLLRVNIRNDLDQATSVHWHGLAIRNDADGVPGVPLPSATLGARKDTVLVPAMQAVGLDLIADNLGSWMLHGHNAFHMETGMMTRLEYVV